MADQTYYITTPIYYVNDKPHIGHAYTTVLADVLSRFHRLLGEEVRFLTGTDEHGQKVQQAADAAGRTPQEHADATVVRFQELWDKLEITHNDFIRTTEPRHTRIVQEILQDLYDRGEIYKADYDGWYDVNSEQFVTEKELEGGKPPESRPDIIRITESNYFFKMSRHQEWLIQTIEGNPEFIQPDFRRNETLGFLRQPLQDLCISRPKSRLSWGIELPFDADFVTYVWFDALVNYISAVGYRSDEQQFQQWWPASVHLIGKDILTTHTVYWPTMLKAMGVPLPKTIFAHGWWLSGQSKMSKSLGNVVDPMDMIETFGVDPFRYFLIAEMTLGKDSNFSEEAFIRRYNADLANDLGNLLSRLVNMIERYCDGTIPSPDDQVLEGDEENKLWTLIQESTRNLESTVRSMRLDLVVANAITGVRAINRYLEIRKPWNLAKEDDRSPLSGVLYTAVEALRVSAGLLHPVMPGKMEELYSAIGLSPGDINPEALARWGVVSEGSKVKKPGSLFPRMETKGKDRDVEESTLASDDEKQKEGELTNEDGYLTIDDFSRLTLKTAKIIEAEKVPNADKLLRLVVFMGKEKRQLVAGLALHYTPEELIGKTVVVVANLKPATIRGVESNGMVLAATKGESLKLIIPDGEISSGADVG